MKNYSYKYVVVFFIICISNLIVAQNQREIDSLVKIAQKTPDNKNKVAIYGKVFNLYKANRNNLKSAKKYVDSMQILSKEVQYDLGIAIAFYNYATLNQYKGEFSKAIENLEISIQFNEKAKDTLRLANTFYAKSKAYKNLGEYEKSLSHLHKASSYYEALKDLRGIADSYNNMGNINNRIGNLEESIANYNKALEYYKKMENIKMYAMSLQNIGNVYTKMKMFKKGLVLMEQAYSLIENSKWEYEKAIILGNMGDLFNGLNKHNEALKYQLRSYKIKKNLPSKNSKIFGLTSIGQSYLNLNQYQKADSYFDKALTIAKEIEAKHHLENLYNLKAKVGEKSKNYENAYHNIITSYQLKDSILGLEKTKEIAKLQTKYQTAQKDKEIELLTKENQLQEAKSDKESTLRKTLIIGLVLFTIIASLIFYNLRQRLKNQKLLVEKNEEIKRSQYREQLQTLEMKALRAQMNPHFLFNSLNSINTMIISDENENASKYLSKFSKLVRLMLENSEQPRVSLKDEINMLESYVQLEALRFNNKIDYKIEVDNKINQDSTYIPSMVLQPFVENAIWHGLLHKDKKGLLTIIINENKDKLHCSIIDNGIGRDKSLTLQKEGGLKMKSMGIKITTERLRLLTKKKINEVISIVDLKDNNNNALGTQVNIKIPMS